MCWPRTAESWLLNESFLPGAWLNWGPGGTCPGGVWCNWDPGVRWNCGWGGMLLWVVLLIVEEAGRGLSIRTSALPSTVVLELVTLAVVKEASLRCVCGASVSLWWLLVVISSHAMGTSGRERAGWPLSGTSELGPTALLTMEAKSMSSSWLSSMGSVWCVTDASLSRLSVNSTSPSEPLLVSRRVLFCQGWLWPFSSLAPSDWRPSTPSMLTRMLANLENFSAS